jgi:outer membrane protein TolC
MAWTLCALIHGGSAISAHAGGAAARPEQRELTLSLSDAVFIGLRNNTSIRSAYIDRVAQKFDLRVAEDVFTPHVSINAQALHQRTMAGTSQSMTAAPQVTATTPLGTTFDFTWNNALTNTPGQRSRSSVGQLTFNQPLLNGAGIDVNMAPVRTARLTEQNNVLNLQSTIAQTIANIIISYRAVMQSNKALGLAEEAEKRAATLLDNNKAMVAAGRLARLDLVQNEADLANQRLAILQARQQLQTNELALLTLLSLSLQTKIQMKERLETPNPNFSVDRLLSIAFAKRQDYLAQINNVEMSRLGVVVAENQRLWNLAIVGGVAIGKTLDASAGVNTGTKVLDRSIGIQLSGPLNDLHPEQAAVHASTSQKSAELQLEVIHQGVEQQIRTSVAVVQLGWQQLDVARKAETLALSAVDIERQKMAVGKSSVFQVQSLEASYRNAQTQTLNSEISYLNSLTALDLALGTTCDTWKINVVSN